MPKNEKKTVASALAPLGWFVDAGMCIEIVSQPQDSEPVPIGVAFLALKEHYGWASELHGRCGALINSTTPVQQNWDSTAALIRIFDELESAVGGADSSFGFDPPTPVPIYRIGQSGHPGTRQVRIGGGQDPIKVPVERDGATIEVNVRVHACVRVYAK